MEKYLQKLLKEVNTVIIPGLGALTVTNHSTGEIMFMPYLKYDDGKLSSYIADSNNSTIEEAKEFISNRVEGILNKLENEGGVNILGVGVFSKSSSGDIEFVSNQISELANEEEVIEVDFTSNEDFINSEDTIKEEPISDVLTENEVYLEPSSIKEEVLEITSNSENDEVEDTVVKKKDLLSFLKSNTDTSFSSDEEVVEVDEQEEEFSIPTEEESIDFEEEREFTTSINSNLVNEEVISSSEDVEVDPETPDLTEEKIIENDKFSSETEELKNDLDIVNQSNKKKRGVKFWILLLLLLVVLGGGAFVGLNFEKFKPLIPFIAKTDSIDEQKIIEKLESDKTKPSNEVKTKSEEMISSTEVIEENTTNEVKEEPIVSESSIEKPKLDSKKKINTKKAVKKITTDAPINDGSHKSFIILGTFSEQVNAINLLDKIVAKGIKSASILERNGNFSVCYASFPTKEEAISKLSEAKSAFTSAWVFNKP